MSRSFLDWPVLRQLSGADPLGRGPAVRSTHTEQITARTVTYDYERLMEGAKKVKTSEFAGEMIKHMG